MPIQTPLDDSQKSILGLYILVAEATIAAQNKADSSEPELPQFDFITAEMWERTPETERNRRMKDTLEYLQDIPGMKDAFKKKKGDQQVPLTVEEFCERFVLAKQGLLDSNAALPQRVSLPADVLFEWMYHLHKKWVALAPKSSQAEAIASILKKEQLKWLSKKFKPSDVKSTLEKDRRALLAINHDNQNIDALSNPEKLAKLAYNPDGSGSLYDQLPLSDTLFSSYIQDNKKERQILFEKIFFQQLLNNPPQILRTTMQDIAQGLEGMLDEMPNDVLENSVIPALFKSIASDQRAWFKDNAIAQAFCQAALDLGNSNEDKLMLLRDFLTDSIDDGQRFRFVFYLMEKLYLARLPFTHFLKSANKAWIKHVETHPENPIPTKLFLAEKNTESNTQSGKKKLLFSLNGDKGKLIPSVAKYQSLDDADDESEDGDILPQEEIESGNNRIAGPNNVAAKMIHIFLGTLEHIVSTQRGLSIKDNKAILSLLMYLSGEGIPMERVLSTLFFIQIDPYYATGFRAAPLSYKIRADNVIQPSDFSFSPENVAIAYPQLAQLASGNPKLGTILENAYAGAWNYLFEDFEKAKDTNWQRRLQDEPSFKKVMNDFKAKLKSYHYLQSILGNLFEDFEQLIRDTIKVSSKPITRVEAIEKISEVLSVRVPANFVKMVENRSIRRLPRMLKAVIDSTAYAANAEARLLVELKSHPMFDGINENNLWRLVTDLQHSERYQYELSTHSVSSMYSAFEKMLKKVHKPLSVDELLGLYKKSLARSSAKEGYRTRLADDFIDDATSDNSVISKIFSVVAFDSDTDMDEREWTISHEFPLIIQTENNGQAYNATQRGVEELLILSRKDDYQFFKVDGYQYDYLCNLKADANGKVGTLKIFVRGPLKRYQQSAQTDSMTDYFNQVIERYHQEMTVAESSRAKLFAIAKACRGLALIRPFTGDEGHAVAIFILNKLLLQNGFVPTILENVGHVEGLAIDELVEKIEQGQEVFLRVQRGESVGAPSLSDTSTEDERGDVASDLVADQNEINSDSLAHASGSVVHRYERKYLELESYLLDKPSTSFLKGYSAHRYESVTIPHWRATMSLFEMKVLALSLSEKRGDSKQEVLGALLKRIMLRQGGVLDPQIQRIQTALTTQSAFNDLTGFNYHRPLSQLIYTVAVERNSMRGICYGLVWAMGLALSKQGQQGIENFAGHIDRAAEYPGTQSAIWLKSILRGLHNQANLYFAARQDRGLSYFSLDAVFTQLEQAATGKVFELGTTIHAMMLGVSFSRGKRTFYFYDPNKGVVAYNDIQSLKTALSRYLNESQRITSYEPYKDAQSSTPDALLFEFVEINVEAVEELRFRFADNVTLTIDVLVQPDSLSHVVRTQQENQRRGSEVSLDISRVTIDTTLSLERSLSELNGQYLVRSYLDAVLPLYKDSQLNADDIPLLNQIELSENGYRIPFLSRQQSQTSLKWIETADGTLFKTAEYLNEHIKKINETHNLNAEFQLEKKVGIESDLSIDGLNSAFLIQQLSAWVQAARREAVAPDETKLSTNLAIALNIHSYISLIQIAQGTTHDVVTVISLVRTLLNEGYAVTSMIPSTLTKIVSVSGQATGSLSMGLSAVLDAYEFSHAENAIQKAVFATHLTFDTACVVLNAVGMGAGWMGASTVAGFVMPLSTVVAGVGVGAAGLAEVYGEVAEETKVVADYFTALEKAYKTAYQYDATQKVMSFLPGAVITEVDFEKGVITRDSQYLYASDYGVFGYADSPTDNDNRDKVFSLREAWGYQAQSNIQTIDLNAAVVILPATSKSYIHTYSQRMLGVRSTKGDEYDSIRKVENNSQGRFKFEYFVFPYASTIRSITSEYLETTITLSLDKRNRTLLMPKIEPVPLDSSTVLETQSHRTNTIVYKINSQGGNVITLGLNSGAKLILKSVGGATEWVLDSSYLETDALVFTDTGLTVGGVNIEVAAPNENNIFLLDKNNQRSRIDFVNRQSLIETVDVQSLGITHSGKLAAYLKDLTDHHRLANQYTLLKNYIHKGVDIGHAYYDSKNKRLLFSSFALVASSKLTELDGLLNQAMEEIAAPFVETVTQIIEWQNNKLYEYYQAEKKMQVDALKKIYSLVQSAQIKNLPAPLGSLSIELQKWFAKYGYDVSYTVTTAKKLVSNVNVHAGRNVSAAKRINYDKFYDSTSPLRYYTSVADNYRYKQEALALFSSLNSQFQQSRETITSIQVANQVCREAQLIAVIGHDIYFYHAEKQLVWRADSKTHQIRAQFILPLKSERCRFWVENKALYMSSISGLSGEIAERGEFVYRIYDDKMIWVGVNLGIQSQTTELDVATFFSKNVAFSGSPNLLCLQHNAPNYSFPNSILSVSKSNADCIVVLVRDNQQIKQRYWLMNQSQSKSTFILRFNAPTADIPDDLMLAKAIKVSNDYKEDIFYFYSPTQKKLFRQQGYGVSGYEIDQSLKKTTDASVLSIAGLSDVIEINNDLFAATEEGLIKNIDVKGNLKLTAVNEKWLAARATTWRQDLASLVKAEPTQTVLSVIGIKMNGVTLPVWYVRGKLIISTSSNVAFQFLDLDAKGEYARLFDTNSGKVVKLAVMDELTLSSALGNGTVLEQADKVPALIDLFPNFRVQSATVINHLLRVVTQEGVVFGFDGTSTYLIGVTSTWIAQYTESNLAGAMDALAALWPHGETLLVKNAAVPTWYHFAAHKLIQANELAAADKPELIGVDPSHKFAYVYSPIKGIQAYSGNGQTLSVKVMSPIQNKAHRFGETLLLQGGESNDVLQPIALENVKLLTMSGGKGKDRYQIDMEDRSNFKVITIDNYDADASVDELELEVKDIGQILFSRKNDDLLLADHDGAILFKNVWGKYSHAYTHLNIVLSDKKTIAQHESLAEWVSGMAENITQTLASLPSSQSNQAETVLTTPTTPSSTPQLSVDQAV